MSDAAGSVRELTLSAARQLDGFWFAATLGDTAAQPLTPLGEQLTEEGAELFAEAMDAHGASLPRRNRRLVRVEGQLYQAFKPLERAAREFSSIDPESLAFAVACESLPEARRSARRAQLGLASLATLGARLAAKLGAVEQRALVYEQDASQHYRWLVELDLGILPDDALSTTLAECAAIQRRARALELDVALELFGVYAALFALARRIELAQPERLVAAALVPEALTFPSATPALALSRLHAGDSSDERRRALDDFLNAFGERGPNEADPFSARWSETSAQLETLLEKLTRAASPRSDRIAQARHERSAELERARRAGGFVEAQLQGVLVRALTRLVLLRSRLLRVRARCTWMLRRVTLDVDRRLSRLLSAPPGTAFFLRLAELMDSTVRPEQALVELAAERRRRWHSFRERSAPPALIGRDVMEASLETEAPESASPGEARRPRTNQFGGVGVGFGVVNAPVRVARDFEELLALEPGDALVVRSLDPSWAPAFPLLGAIVTDAGGLADEGVITAATLGVPLVIGAREATRWLHTGERVRVDAGRGTVERA